MRGGERIPLHAHTDGNDGGPLAATSTATTTGGVGSSGGGSSSGGSGTVSSVIGLPGSLPWFNVMWYGATGDGSTDDTSAINAAIAALNSAGRGVLYFPAATGYKVTAALTTITVPFMVLGDGAGGYSSTEAVSEIQFTSATAVCFTTTSLEGLFAHISIRNTAGSTPSAGSGIYVSRAASIDQLARVDFDDVRVQRFYDNVDYQGGTFWGMRNCQIGYPIRYGLRVRNTSNVDWGGWSVTASRFYGDKPNNVVASALLRIESSGNGVVNSCTFIDASTYHIDIVGGAGTSVLDISDCSLESYVTTGIRSVGAWAYQRFVNLEFGQYGNGLSWGTGHALDLSSNTDVILDNLNLVTDVSSKTAIALSSMTRCAIGHVTNNGFATLISGTPDQDATGGVGAQVFITGTPIAGQVPVASSGTAAAWGSSPGSTTHSESLTDGNSNFIFAAGDIITVVGVPN